VQVKFKIQFSLRESPPLIHLAAFQMELTSNIGVEEFGYLRLTIASARVDTSSRGITHISLLGQSYTSAVTCIKSNK